MFNLNGKKYPCCTSLTMAVIGGKWKSVILYHLMEGPLRYSELRNKIEGITERTLSIQLKKLEEDGIVSRKVYVDFAPIKVEYALTECGETLKPLLNSIAEWGEQYANCKLH